jgi:proteasome assembly chaperone 3
LAPHATESISLEDVLTLETLAAYHPSATVRGQAAGWYVAAMGALRIEQASSCVVNAVVPVTVGAHTAYIAVGAVVRDKHPDKAKQKPRPFLAIVSGLLHGSAVCQTLVDTLGGRAAEARAIILDSDSPTGDPTTATRLINYPLRPGARADASLQALLRLGPAPPPAEQVERYHRALWRYHGHSCRLTLVSHGHNKSGGGRTEVLVCASAPLPRHTMALRESAFEAVVCGVPTRFVLTAYSNRIFVVVTQTHNMGTLIHAEADNPIAAGTTAFSTRVLLGRRDDDVLEVYARTLMEMIHRANPETGPLLLALSIREHSQEMFRAILKEVQDHKVW